MTHYGLVRAGRSVCIGALIFGLVACTNEIAELTGDSGVAVSAEALTSPPDTTCTSATSAGREYWFCSTKRSWATARQKCQAVAGRDLVVIGSLTENQFIYPRLPGDSWIGATDQVTEGVWRWAPTGTQFWQGSFIGWPVGGAYTAWAIGEPNDLFNQDCAVIGRGLALGAWRDESCTGTREYVCEAVDDQCPNDPNKTQPGQCGCGVADTDSDGDGTANCNDGCSNDPGKTSPGQCGCGTADTDSDSDGTANCNDGCPSDPARIAPDCAPESGCTRLLHGTSAYWFCNERHSWSAARSKCTDAGYQFARIDSAAENDFVEQHIASDRWIGGSDLGIEGSWRWEIDGDAFWQGGASGAAVDGAYTDWGFGQPSNFLGEQDCLQVVGIGGWIADNCSDTEQYICEDLCPTDVNKSQPGVCGCGTSDVDSDGDGTPDCGDDCPNDPLHLVPGECGCVGEPDLKPAGTLCYDGPCAAAAQCDGAGDCGEVDDCLPRATCTEAFYEGRLYFVCSDLLDQEDARAACQAQPDMDLARVDDEAENTFLRETGMSSLWLGGTDSEQEGEWQWIDDGSALWSGGPSGAAPDGRYANWAIGNPHAPATDRNCLKLRGSDGKWLDEACSTASAFVCEVLGDPVVGGDPSSSIHPWPMAGLSIVRDGHSPYIGTTTPTVQWQVSLGGSIATTAVLSFDNLVLSGSQAGVLHAVDLDGQSRWTFDAGSPITSSPVLASSKVIYVGSDDATVNALDTADGSVLWSQSVGGALSGTPVVGVNGTLYATDRAGNLTALSATGTVNWTFSAEPIRGAPAVGADGSIVFGSDSGHVYAVASNGIQRWRTYVGGAVYTTPAISASNRVMVGTQAGELIALDLDSGAIVWTFVMSGAVLSSPALDQNGVAYVGSDDGSLYAVEPNGVQRWAFSTGGAVRSSPAIDGDGNVYVGSNDGKLYAVSPGGQLRWSLPLGSAVTGSPSIAATGGILVGTAAGQLFAVGERVGHPVDPHPGNQAVRAALDQLRQARAAIGMSIPGLAGSFGDDGLMLDYGAGGFVSAVAGIPYLVDLEDVPAGATPTDIAHLFWQQWGHLWGMGEPGHVLVHRETLDDRFDGSHLLFDEEYYGVRVSGVQLAVHIDAMGRVVSANGTYVRGISVNPQPEITSEDLVNELQEFPTIAIDEGPTLTVFDPFAWGHVDGPPALAYEVTLRNDDSDDTYVLAFFDAHDGGVVHSQPLGQDYSIYQATTSKDTVDEIPRWVNGVDISCSTNSTCSAWQDRIQTVMDMWSDRFGWPGLPGFRAYYNSQKSPVCSGATPKNNYLRLGAVTGGVQGLDIVAHEMGHTLHKTFLKEGDGRLWWAVGEHLADVNDMWLSDEASQLNETGGANCSATFNDWTDPCRNNHPDSWRWFQHRTAAWADDIVHTNNDILSKFAWLLHHEEAPKFHKGMFNLESMGMDAAADLYFRTMAEGHFSGGRGFHEWKNAVIRACISADNLADCEKVEEAWNAVGLWSAAHDVPGGLEHRAISGGVSAKSFKNENGNTYLYMFWSDSIDIHWARANASTGKVTEARVVEAGPGCQPEDQFNPRGSRFTCDWRIGNPFLAALSGPVVTRPQTDQEVAVVRWNGKLYVFFQRLGTRQLGFFYMTPQERFVGPFYLPEEVADSDVGPAVAVEDTYKVLALLTKPYSGSDLQFRTRSGTNCSNAPNCWHDGPSPGLSTAATPYLIDTKWVLDRSDIATSTTPGAAKALRPGFAAVVVESTEGSGGGPIHQTFFDFGELLSTPAGWFGVCPGQDGVCSGSTDLDVLLGDSECSDVLPPNPWNLTYAWSHVRPTIADGLGKFAGPVGGYLVAYSGLFVVDTFHHVLGVPQKQHPAFSQTNPSMVWGAQVQQDRFMSTWNSPLVVPVHEADDGAFRGFWTIYRPLDVAGTGLQYTESRGLP